MAQSPLQLALLSAVTVTVTATCPDSDWVQHGNICYWVSDFQLEWRSVAADCNLKHTGSEPVSVHDLDAHSFLTGVTSGPTWLGLHRDSTAAGWTWADGTSFNWEFWRSDQPYGDGERCGYMNCDTHGEWCTDDCKLGYYYFICQTHA